MTLITALVSTDKYRNIKDLYKCTCGIEFVTRRAAVKSGHTKSCGCLTKQLQAALRVTHGMSSSSEYHTWQQMIARCTNPNNVRFKHYGGRGISACPEWLDSFEVFYNDMGARPKGLSLDRINNDGNYSKFNCRWADIETQNRNKRQRGKKST